MYFETVLNYFGCCGSCKAPSVLYKPGCVLFLFFVYLQRPQLIVYDVQEIVLQVKFRSIFVNQFHIHVLFYCSRDLDDIENRLILYMAKLFILLIKQLNQYLWRIRFPMLPQIVCMCRHPIVLLMLFNKYLFYNSDNVYHDIILMHPCLHGNMVLF